MQYEVHFIGIPVISMSIHYRGAKQADVSCRRQISINDATLTNLFINKCDDNISQPYLMQRVMHFV